VNGRENKMEKDMEWWKNTIGERELKFRAWDEQKKVMHYNFQFIKSGDEGNDWILFVSDKQPLSEDWVNNPYFRQQLKIMESTGLKDKEGKELYEGDIIKITYSKPWEDEIGVIKYDETKGRFFIQLISGEAVGLSTFDKCNIKTGNIYENSGFLVKGGPLPSLHNIAGPCY
jgi:uncharacterized phage protein (TIGR01671 family)